MQKPVTAVAIQSDTHYIIALRAGYFHGAVGEKCGQPP